MSEDYGPVHIMIHLPDQVVQLHGGTSDKWLLVIQDIGADAPDFAQEISFWRKEIGTTEAAAIMALLVGLGEVDIRDYDPLVQPEITRAVRTCYQLAEPVFDGVPRNLRPIP